MTRSEGDSLLLGNISLSLSPTSGAGGRRTENTVCLIRAQQVTEQTKEDFQLIDRI